MPRLGLESFYPVFAHLDSGYSGSVVCGGRKELEVKAGFTLR